MRFLRRTLGLLVLGCQLLGQVPGATLPGTSPLDWDGDLAARMVTGIDRDLDRRIRSARDHRREAWQLDASSSETYLRTLLASAETRRQALKEILGVVDTRSAPALRFVSPAGNVAPGTAGEIARGTGYRIHQVEWEVFRGVIGSGLLLLPEGEPKADLIAVPDCDWTPEQAVGLAPGVPAEQQFPRRFAEAGCRVLVPALVDRGSRFAGNPGYRTVQHSQRETLWRAAYEVGRHPLGYEIQTVLAAADWLDATRSGSPRTFSWESTLGRLSNPGSNHQELGIVGHGEGGLVAFYASAVDPRFLAAGICGAFGLTSREEDLPLYRNVWTLLNRFGDAEVSALVLPRALFLEHGLYPTVVHTDAQGGAPGSLWRPTAAEMGAEVKRITEWLPEMPVSLLNATEDTVCDWGTAQRIFLKLSATGALSQELGPAPRLTGALPDASARTRRLYLQILEDTQELVRRSGEARAAFWKPADTRSPEAFARTVEPLREAFRDETLGSLPRTAGPANPRSRLLYETNGIRGYEVVLDILPDVFAQGILVLPRDLQPGDRRPVVVCQHGLEGRPSDVADPRIESPFYHRFAYRLAERGYVTFSPQNPYIGGTRFRQVLRKAQPLGLTLWSYIVRQHEGITEWLAAQDFVDPARIGFYGLSYGGKTAMRVPSVVPRYCLSLCSADYNEWIWKNTSIRSPYSYLWTSEYDMPEWNLANRFNYAEMSWLIFPRPFMVERGHDDGVAPDEWVAHEFARTRRHYVKLGLGDRTEIEFFDGPHSIHGVGTFEFLDRHLRPQGR